MPQTKRFPDSLTIIMAIMFLFWGLTWIIPAGSFQRETFGSKQVVVPGSFEYLDESQGQNLMEFLTTPIRGMQGASDIIAFVLLIGGVFAIINRTGAIDAGLQSVVRYTQKHPARRQLILPLLITLFSLAGATFGMAEEVLVFIMITIPMAQSLGYDRIVGIAIPFIGAGAGFAGAFLNPFTVGIAQGIAGVSPGSGTGYRLICWGVFTLVAIIFIMRYANKVHQDPSVSILSDVGEDAVGAFNMPEALDFTSIRALILILFGGSIGLLIYGVNVWGWYINEITGMFFGLGLLVAALARLSPAITVKAFLSGASDVLTAALIIGFARALLVLAEDAMIIDTILNGIATAADGFSGVVSVQVMFIFQSFLNFFVPSGSGQAALTMPVMAPLGDLLGVSRQTTILAYQFGDGISNLIIPTSGILMGVLEIARIPYNKWFKWVLSLIVILSVIAMVLLVFPTAVFEWN
ncbi:MAG: YfcC family protein [Bacteroidota bacterium]